MTAAFIFWGGPCSCWTGPFLVFMGGFYSWAGLLSAPFSLWAVVPVPFCVKGGVAYG